MAEKQITEARVKELIAEAIKGFSTVHQINEAIGSVTKELVSKENLQKIVDNLVSRDTLNSITSGLITKDQWNEALDGMLSSAVPLTGIRPELASAETQTGRIPAEYLSGLVFRSSKQKKTEAGTANVPTERALTPDDVMSWKDNGETVTVITTDGQKYTVDTE